MNGKHELNRISEMLACSLAIIVNKKEANSVITRLLDSLFNINISHSPTRTGPRLCIRVTYYPGNRRLRQSRCC
jgi:hypothetical protein